MLIDNRNKYGILRGTNKRIFTTSGNRAQFTGVEDDHKPFEKKGKDTQENYQSYYCLLQKHDQGFVLRFIVH